MTSIIHNFSPHLFWDATIENIDMESNAPYIVQRVLEYGLLSDWKIIKEFYGIPRIATICKSLRTLEPRSLAFISQLSQTPKEEYRCYTLRQSNQQPWNY